MSALAAWPADAFVLLAGLVGLLVGSFINVLVLRLPVMLQRAWADEAHAMLQPDAPAPTRERFDLLYPGSRCNACGTSIRWWQNVPVLSWLWLRGRCAACSAPISPRYPLVEATSALATAALVALHGLDAWTGGEALLLWGLIALALIDYDTTLLPDDLTLPLLWLGLLLHAWLAPQQLGSSVLGAALGYASLWTVYQGFKLATGKEGMGYGDFKLFAALGAWFGALALLPMVLLSALSGAVIGIALQLTGVTERGRPIPFGPFLAAAGLITLYAGPQTVIGWVLPGHG